MPVPGQVHRRVALLGNLGFFDSPGCDCNPVVKLFANESSSGLCRSFRRHTTRRCRHDRTGFFDEVITSCGLSCSQSRNADDGSDEEGLQSGPEGGNWRERMIFEGLLQMCQRELGWAIRDDLGRLAQSSQRRSDGGLCV